jgi:hypothetical protein
VTEKLAYLVAYDYGQGAVWAIIHARSQPEIEAKYPGLKIYREPPPFLAKKEIEVIAATSNFDIDAPPQGWLAKYAEEIRSSQ